jgi:hypothetical protein
MPNSEPAAITTISHQAIAGVGRHHSAASSAKGAMAITARMKTFCHAAIGIISKWCP